MPVAGKQVTDTPEILFKSQIGYDNGSFFVRADVNHTDERFYTYLNEGSVDAYTLLNVGVGYTLPDVRRQSMSSCCKPTRRISPTRSTSARSTRTASSTSDPNGTAQTLLLGAPRQFFVSMKARF